METKYYRRKADGGYSPCILGNNDIIPRHKDMNVLPNCVGYAVGAFNEYGHYGACKWLASRNACLLYEIGKNQGLAVGNEPKEGALIVWSGGSTGAGHCAIVRQVIDANTIVIEESGWSAKSYYWKSTHTKGDGNWTNGESWMKGYKLIGFVYNPAVEEVKPVERNTKVNQVEVCIKELRKRVEPNLKGTILGFATPGIYNVLATSEADGYTWYKIADLVWIASKEGDWTKFYPAQDKTKDIELILDNINKELDEIRNKLKEV